MFGEVAKCIFVGSFNALPLCISFGRFRLVFFLLFATVVRVETRNDRVNGFSQHRLIFYRTGDIDFEFCSFVV